MSALDEILYKNIPTSIGGIQLFSEAQQELSDLRAQLEAVTIQLGDAGNKFSGAIAELEAMTEERDAAKSDIDGWVGWARHRDSCACRHETACDCGLSELLERWNNTRKDR